MGRDIAGRCLSLSFMHQQVLFGVALLKASSLQLVEPFWSWGKGKAESVCGRGRGGGKFRTEVCINARLNVIMRHTVVRTRAGLRFYNQHLVMLHSGPLITTRGTIPCTCSVFHVHIAVPLHIPLLYTRQVLIACLMQKTYHKRSKIWNIKNRK